MSAPQEQSVCKPIPKPVVTFNRSIMFVGNTAAILLQEPLITTALFLILLPAVIWGQRASLIFFTGSKLFGHLNSTAQGENPKLMRFNNTIAASLLGCAQLAFLLGAPVAGWIFSGMVAVAALIALMGFCFGCVLFYQFNMQKHRFFGSN